MDIGQIQYLLRCPVDKLDTGNCGSEDQLGLVKEIWELAK